MTLVLRMLGSLAVTVDGQEVHPGSPIDLVSHEPVSFPVHPVGSFGIREIVGAMRILCVEICLMCSGDFTR